MSRRPIISRCSISRASRSRRTSRRAVELLRSAADAGSPEAQYALATLYKEGSGVPKDPVAAAKLLAAAARSGNDAAQVEYAIALFNGTGVPKDESRRGRDVPQGRAQGQRRSRRTGSRASWRPAAACRPIRSAAIKWHTIAKAGGASDVWLENYMQSIKAADRTAGENAARLWLAHAQPRGRS